MTIVTATWTTTDAPSTISPRPGPIHAEIAHPSVLSTTPTTAVSSIARGGGSDRARTTPMTNGITNATTVRAPSRSEEHTSELQSRLHLVCRLLLEKKKQKKPERRS